MEACELSTLSPLGVVLPKDPLVSPGQAGPCSRPPRWIPGVHLAEPASTSTRNVPPQACGQKVLGSQATISAPFCMCVCMCVSVCRSMCVSVGVCVSVHVCMYLYMYVCVCMCIYVCLCPGKVLTKLPIWGQPEGEDSGVQLSLICLLGGRSVPRAPIQFPLLAPVCGNHL